LFRSQQVKVELVHRRGYPDFIGDVTGKKWVLAPLAAKEANISTLKGTNRYNNFRKKKFHFLILN